MGTLCPDVRKICYPQPGTACDSSVVFGAAGSLHTSQTAAAPQSASVCWFNKYSPWSPVWHSSALRQSNDDRPSSHLEPRTWHTANRWTPTQLKGAGNTLYSYTSCRLVPQLESARRNLRVCSPVLPLFALFVRFMESLTVFCGTTLAGSR